MMLAGDYKPLVDYERWARMRALDSDARSLLAAALRPRCAASNERSAFPVEGVDGGSISMLSVQIG